MQKMKVILAIILSWFAGSAESTEQMQLKTIIERDAWTLSEGTHSGKPLLIRFRDELGSKKPNIKGYANLVTVTWTYDGGESGMPDSKSSDAMEVFENRLILAVERDLSAVLSAVATNNNQREWFFYSKSVQEFGHRLSNMPQERERYPIDITTEFDPSWSLFFKFYNGAK
jgi:hypothetical protein